MARHRAPKRGSSTQQVERDHPRQDDVEDHSADLSQRGPPWVLQHIGPTVFCGSGGLRFELVEIGVDA
jgi:hypothetical protein